MVEVSAPESHQIKNILLLASVSSSSKRLTKPNCLLQLDPNQVCDAREFTDKWTILFANLSKRYIRLSSYDLTDFWRS